MKTATIKTPTAELLLVELPQGWIFNTYKDQIGVCNEINKPMTQIKGSYTLLGKPDEIREEDARELVKQSIHTGLFAHYVKDIPVNTYCYKTAKESLRTFDRGRTLIFIKKI